MNAKTLLRALNESVHPFDRFGTAPYRFLGVTKNWFSTGQGDAGKPGGTCDYCGTGIAYEYHFQSADGRKFKVGSECMLKADRDPAAKAHVAMYGGPSLSDIAKREKAKIDKQNKLNAAAQRFETLRSLLPQVEATLKQYPHPHASYMGRPLTLYDWVKWMVDNNAGKDLAYDVVMTALGKSTKGQQYFTKKLNEAETPKQVWRVDYWKRSKGYASVKQRKFKSRDEAYDFVSRVDDDGYDTEVFEPGSSQGDTWNGSSKF